MKSEPKGALVASAILCIVSVSLLGAPVTACAQAARILDNGTPPAVTAAPQDVDSSFLPTTSWIVAKVNDEIVTLHEVIEKIKAQLVALRVTYEGEAYRKKARDLWDKTLSELVEERVMLQVARKEGIEITWKDVDKSIDEEIKRAGSRERFDQNLSQTGQNLDVFRENMRRQLIMRDLIYRRVGIKEPKDSKNGLLPNDPVATPREIHEYYDAHKDEFFLEEKVVPRQIILRFGDDESRRGMMEIAQSLLRQLKAGAEFPALAVWYSKVRPEEAGLWDWTARGSLPSDIEDTVFALKVGENTAVLETGNTLRIIRLESRQEPRQQGFGEVQEEIKKRIQNKRIMDQIEKVKQEIYKDNYIWPPEVIKKKNVNR